MKKVLRNCYGCKRFQAMAYAAPPPGYLPTTRTEAVNPFQVIGVDYASPLRYRISRQREIKGYVLLNACSLTRGSTWISYQVWKQMSAWGSSLGSEGDWSESIPTMVEHLLVLWSGSGQWGKTYYLSVNQIKWLIGLIKSALHKSVGNGMLRWKELEDAVRE